MTEKTESKEQTEPGLSIIIPVYNEEESLPFLVDKLASTIASINMPCEIIFIDDGSIDSSVKEMKKLKKEICPEIRIIELAQNCGQSAAFAAGFQSAKGTIIATLDADLQNDPADIPALVGILDSCDMVVGWRKNRNDPLIRKISTRISNFVRKNVLQDGFHDTACSLRVFRKECTQDLVMFNGMHRFLPTLVKTEGFRVKEVVVGHHERKYGQAKYNIRNRLFRALADMFGVLWLQNRRITYRVKSEE